MPVKWAAALLLLCARGLAAHTGEPLEPHDLWSAWSFDPGIVIPLVLSAVLYARGATRARGFRWQERAAFWAGWAALVVALISPLHPLGEALFSAHMAQHEVLMVVAAPLLVIGRPLIAMLWSLPFAMRGTVGQWAKAFTRPAGAWAFHAVVLWGWHIPALFQATLTSDLVHSLQHASFLGSAVLFWWALLPGQQNRMGQGAAVLYVFTTAIHTSILGAFLTFSPVVWYPAYEGRTAAWGLSAIEDQQIGGLIMWVPAGLTYIAAGLWLIASWIRESEARVLQRERV